MKNTVSCVNVTSFMQRGHVYIIIQFIPVERARASQELYEKLDTREGEKAMDGEREHHHTYL